MAVNLTSLSGMVCDKLDTNAGLFWDNEQLKQFHRKFIEMHSLLQKPRSCRFDQNVALNSLFTHLEGLISEVDELIDAWVQSEITRSKFDLKLRRIDGRLAAVLKVLSQTLAPSQIVAGNCDEAIGSISQVRSENTVLEREIESLVSTVKDELLRNVNRALVLLLAGVSRTGKKALAHEIFMDEMVKSQFPFRFWHSVGRNQELLRVLNAIAAQCADKKVCERLLIVLDDLCDLTDEKLENFKLLISNLRHLRPCVVVTTSSDYVETMIRTVPAQHLTYFPETNTLSYFNNDSPPPPGADSCSLGHEEDLRLQAPESLQTPSTSRVIDDLSGHIEELSKNVPTPNVEGESAMDEDAPPRPKNLNEEMVCPPPTDALAMETVGRLAAHVAGTTVTSSNMELEDETCQSGMKYENEDFQSEMEFEDETFQNKQKVRRIV